MIMHIGYSNGYYDCLNDILGLVDDSVNDDFFNLIRVNRKSLASLVRFLIKHRHRFMMEKQCFEINARILDRGTKKARVEFTPKNSELREMLYHKGAIDMLNEERRENFKATGDEVYEGDIKYE